MDPNRIMSLLMAFMAYVGWSLCDVLGIKLFRSNDSSKVTFLNGMSRLIFWMILMPFFYRDFGRISAWPLAANLLAGLGSGFGYYCFGRAAKLTNPMLVAAISGGWGASSVLLGLVFFGETLSLPQWCAIILVFSGFALVTFRSEWLKKLNLIREKGLLYAFLAFFGWGICGAFLKIPAVAYGWYLSSVIMLLPYIILLLLDPDIRHGLSVSSLRINGTGLFLAVVILTIIGDLGYNSSFSFGANISEVGTLAGSYATLSAVLAYFLYREPITKKQLAGVIVSLIGIVGTAYFSSVA